MPNRSERTLSASEVRPGDVIRWGSRKRWALVQKVRKGPFWLTWVLVWAFGNDAGKPCTLHRDAHAEPGLYTAKDPLDARRVHELLGWSETGQKVASTSRHEAAALLRSLAVALDSGAAVEFEIKTTHQGSLAQHVVTVWAPEQVQP